MQWTLPCRVSLRSASSSSSMEVSRPSPGGPRQLSLKPESLRSEKARGRLLCPGVECGLLVPPVPSPLDGLALRRERLAILPRARIALPVFCFLTHSKPHQQQIGNTMPSISSEVKTIVNMSLKIIISACSHKF